LSKSGRGLPQSKTLARPDNPEEEATVINWLNCYIVKWLNRYIVTSLQGKGMRDERENFKFEISDRKQNDE
jgi:hypothetical protein